MTKKSSESLLRRGTRTSSLPHPSLWSFLGTRLPCYVLPLPFIVVAIVVERLNIVADCVQVTYNEAVNVITTVPGSRDVPLAKNPSTGTAQQRLFLVLKVVLHAVVVISEVLRLSTKSRCSRCCGHISTRECISNERLYEFLGV